MILEIFFNSTSSVLSYNNFDFGQIFTNRKSNSGENQHESTFFKQAVYFILFTLLNFGYIFKS